MEILIILYPRILTWTVNTGFFFWPQLCSVNSPSILALLFAVAGLQDDDSHDYLQVDDSLDYYNH